MSCNDPSLRADQMIEVQCEDRWQVYHRLRELEISCWCSCYQPLKVQVTGAVTAIQIWSVVKLTMPRQTLVHWLETCWLSRLPERD